MLLWWNIKQSILSSDVTQASNVGVPGADGFRFTGYALTKVSVRTHAVKCGDRIVSGWHIHVSLEVFSPDSCRINYRFPPTVCVLWAFILFLLFIIIFLICLLMYFGNAWNLPYIACRTSPVPNYLSRVCLITRWRRYNKQFWARQNHLVSFLQLKWIKPFDSRGVTTLASLIISLSSRDQAWSRYIQFNGACWSRGTFQACRTGRPQYKDWETLDQTHKISEMSVTELVKL